MNGNGQDKEQGFTFAYSAKEQSELLAIREKYLPKTEEESSLERLRSIERRVNGLAQSTALAFGVVGILAFGFGMSLFLSELSSILALSAVWTVILGISAAAVGAALCAFAYPVYSLVLKNQRQKMAPRVLAITDKLMK